MFKKKTEVSSQGEKIKKFKMPVFPSALVITFCVLLFVVLLSWIPHKGWVDVTSPFLLIQDGYIWGPEGIDPLNPQPWGVIDVVTLAADDGSVETITFHLTNKGAYVLAEYLSIPLGKWTNFLGKVNVTAPGAFEISNIELGGEKQDWNQVGINYSSLSFELSLEGFSWDNGDGQNIKNTSSATVTIDQIFQNSKLVGDDGSSMGFAIISGSVNTHILEFNDKGVVVGEIEQGFISGNVANDWFNFWGSNYYLGDSNGRYGILNIPFVLVGGFFNSTGVILYLFCIGAFVEVMLQSGALEAGTSSLVKKMKGKELILIPVLFCLFCFGGTAFGMQEETLGLIPLIIPFLVLAGFDTMTGLLIVVVGTTAGIGASVLDPFSVGVMSGSLAGEGIPEVSLSDGIVIRIIEFLVFLVLGSSFCTWYGHRSRKGKNFVVEPEMYEKNKKWAHEMLGESHATHTGLTKRQSIGLGIFAATFGIMVFSLLPWTEWFGNLETNEGWQVFSSLFFAKILFGEWYFIQLSFMFLIVAFILGWVFGMKQKETNKAIYTGMKGMIGLGIILTVSRGVEIVLGYSGLTIDMVAMMFGGTGGGGFGAVGLAWIIFPIFLFLATFISSTSGLAAITGPIIAPMLWQLSHQSPEQFAVYATVIMVTYPLAQGTINMFMPTTGLVIAQSEVAKVNFGKALPILTGVAIGTMLVGMTIISISIPLL